MAFTEHERRDAHRRFRELLERERLQPGSKLPGEAALCTKLAISRHAIRVVLEEAQAEGLIDRRGRSGTYLARRPEPGRVPLLDRGWAPAGGINRTISILLSFAVRTEELLALQQFALARGYLLQVYFSPEHRNRPEEERAYLEKAVSNAYAGALIHATPIQPVNEEFFRKASAHLRIAHIGHHSDELPSQSFFLPDLAYAGAACAAHLLALGCRKITLATGLPEGHHVPRLIRRGMDPICAAHGVEAVTLHHGRGQMRAFRKLLDGDRRRGVILSSWDDVIASELPDMRRGIGGTLIVLAECLVHPLAPGLSGWIFDWRAAVTDALAWAMSGHEGLTHRLYRPRWVGQQQ